MRGKATATKIFIADLDCFAMMQESPEWIIVQLYQEMQPLLGTAHTNRIIALGILSFVQRNARA